MPNHKRRSLLFPLIITVLMVAAVAWQWQTESVMRAFAMPAMVLLWLVLLAFWWALSSRPGRKVRVGGVLAVLVIGALAVKFLVRYEGSADAPAGLGVESQRSAARAARHCGIRCALRRGSGS
ncbi:MAG: hypothetical protein KDK99_06265 [Verrucomicrobiales bacterium]|nr:hypothetical protein [Verrucomicrobiales bacterium]